MKNIPLGEVLGKLPIGELDETMNEFLAPATELLPEKRLRRVVRQAVCGILGQHCGHGPKYFSARDGLLGSGETPLSVYGQSALQPSPVIQRHVSS